MPGHLLKDRDAAEDAQTRVTIHVPDHATLNEHLDETDGTVAVTIDDGDEEVTALLDREGVEGKATLVFRVSAADGALGDRRLEEIAAALSDDLMPFVAVRPDEHSPAAPRTADD